MPLPFKDNTFDLILANHILEHVPNWWACFTECARILKPGGKIEVWGPGMGSDGVMGFRDHLNTINQCSFFGTFGFSRPNNAWAMANTEEHAASLKNMGVALHFYDVWWLNILPYRARVWCANHLRNCLYEIGFYFEKQAQSQKEPDLDYRTVEALL